MSHMLCRWAIVSIAALGAAALYGALTTLVFALWPLARARDIPAAGLFRAVVTPTGRLPRAGYTLVLAAASAALVALAVLGGGNRLFALWFVSGAAVVLVELDAVPVVTGDGKVYVVVDLVLGLAFAVDGQFFLCHQSLDALANGVLVVAGAGELVRVHKLTLRVQTCECTAHCVGVHHHGIVAVDVVERL